MVLADKVALLFDGRLQQFDMPDAFYETPKTQEIATFFGGTNFIPGNYHNGVMTTDIGDFTAPHSLVGDEAAVLSIRPEAVELGAEGQNSDAWQTGSEHDS